MPNERIKVLFLYSGLLSAMLAVLALTIVPMGLAAGASFFALLLIIGWSALKYRRIGWLSAIAFCALTLTIPAWVMGAFYLCQNLGLFVP